MQTLRRNYACYAEITQKLRRNYAEITQKLRRNYAEITQITQITHSENNYAKITQKLRNVLGTRHFTRITQKLRKLRKNYANYASAKKLRRLRTPHFADACGVALGCPGRSLNSRGIKTAAATRSSRLYFLGTQNHKSLLKQILFKSSKLESWYRPGIIRVGSRTELGLPKSESKGHGPWSPV